MIEAHALTRRYGDFTAVEDVSFSVAEGEIVGILGPNGAGKTTTIRMITGFLPPTEGRVTVAGKDLFHQPRKARRQIGYLPEAIALYPEMRVTEYLSYRASLEGMSRTEERRALPEVLERCLLTEVRDQIIGTLSKGYRQRVGLATAILHDPRVLVLDEPTVGLDPRQIIAIRELIRELGQKRTLLLSTHILPEVELLCDRVVIFDRGHVVAEGSPDSLRESWRESTVVGVGFKTDGLDPEAASAALAGLPGVVMVHPGVRPGRFRLECSGGADPREAVYHLAVEHGWVLIELSRKKASLEDVFVRLTTDDSEAADEVEHENGDEGETTGAAAGDGDGIGIAPEAPDSVVSARDAHPGAAGGEAGHEEPGREGSPPAEPAPAAADTPDRTREESP